MKLEAGTGQSAEEKAREEKKNDNDINKAMVDAMNKFNGRFKTVNQYKAELLAYQAIADDDKDAFKKQIGKAGRRSPANARPNSTTENRRLKKRRQNLPASPPNPPVDFEKQPLANYADILWQSSKEKEAIEQFKKLQSEISAHLDIDKAVFQRLAPIAKNWNCLKIGAPNSSPPMTSANVRHSTRKLHRSAGCRPCHAVDPHRWTQRQKHSLADYTGKPVIVIFYLGKGCAHCIEQLSAFAPEVDRFKQTGIDLIAISTDHVGGLLETFQLNQNKPFPLPSSFRRFAGSVQAIPRLRRFRIQKQPLHGTFLIDRAGLVRWQDISYEPFEEVEFLLNESKRLLGQDPPQVTKRSLSVKKIALQTHPLPRRGRGLR